MRGDEKYFFQATFCYILSNQFLSWWKNISDTVKDHGISRQHCLCLCYKRNVIKLVATDQYEFINVPWRCLSPSKIRTNFIVLKQGNSWRLLKGPLLWQLKVKVAGMEHMVTFCIISSYSDFSVQSSLKTANWITK